MHITEVENSTAAFIYGRFNPPTIGHKKLFDKLQTVHNVHFVFPTATQDAKKNPLSKSQKIAMMHSQFPEMADRVINDAGIKTIIDVMKFLERAGHKNVIMVAGSDRVQSFNELLNKYNGKEYNFDSIKVVSAGERDPDSDTVEGVSASKAREAAVKGDFATFKTMFAGDDKLKSKMFSALRQAMGVKESIKDYMDEIETNESVEDEAWELLGQTDPNIQKFVQSLGLQNNQQSVQKVVPMIKNAPTTTINPSQIPTLKNLANKGPADTQALRDVQKIKGTPGAPKKFAQIMQQRDRAEGRNRGYDVSKLINAITTGRYEPPVILKLPMGNFVIGGRTRLYAALALNKSIKVKILSPTNEEAAGVGIVTKQNTTKDVNKNTLRKMMKAFHLIK